MNRDVSEFSLLTSKENCDDSVVCGGDATSAAAAADATGSSSSETCAGSENEQYASSLASSLFTGDAAARKSKVLTFINKAPTPKDEGFQQADNLRVLYTQNKLSGGKNGSSRKASRVIPQAPVKVLDAPGLQGVCLMSLVLHVELYSHA